MKNTTEEISEIELYLDSREEPQDTASFVDEIIAMLDTNQKDFCIELGITESSINQIKKTNKLSLDLMRKICKRYEKNAKLVFTI